MNTKAIVSIIGVLIIVAAGVWWFGPANITENPDNTNGSSDQTFTTGQANVDSIDITLLESFPVQVRVVAAGNLPDGCTEIDGSNVSQDEDTFTVDITTKRPQDAMCTQALVPFEETVSLPVEGLTEGTYTVNVNGVTDTFTLEFDNEFQGGEKR